ncbi:hypothetical protein ACFWPU_10765 [Streptomyces sp. NPDC058471]
MAHRPGPKDPGRAQAPRTYGTQLLAAGGMFAELAAAWLRLVA